MSDGNPTLTRSMYAPGGAADEPVLVTLEMASRNLAALRVLVTLEEKSDERGAHPVTAELDLEDLIDHLLELKHRSLRVNS